MSEVLTAEEVKKNASLIRLMHVSQPLRFL